MGCIPSFCNALSGYEAPLQQLAVERQGLRQPVLELGEQFVMQLQFAPPSGAVYVGDAGVLVGAKLQPLPVQIIELRHPAQRRLDGVGLSLAAPDDPTEDAHVFAESGPDELPLGILAEPVDLENVRRLLHFLAYGQPVLEII